MTRWERYERCNTCGADPGQACLNQRAVAEQAVQDHRIVSGRKLTRPHGGRQRNPGRLRGMSASSRAGGHRTAAVGPRWMSNVD